MHPSTRLRAGNVERRKEKNNICKSGKSLNAEDAEQPLEGCTANLRQGYGWQAGLRRGKPESWGDGSCKRG